MITANFTQDTYEVHDEHNRLLFNDNRHKYLFNYLRMNFTQIEVMLERFFSEQFDFDSLRLKEDRPKLEFSEDYEKALQTYHIIDVYDYVIDNAHISEIVDFLEKSHPYFIFDSNALSCAEDIMVDYLNKKSSFRERERLLSYDEYEDILGELLRIPPFYYFRSRHLPSVLNKEYHRIQNHYKDYLSTYRSYSSIRHALRKGRKFDEPFLKIIEEQRFLNEWLLGLLHATDPAMDKQKRVDFSIELNMNLAVFIEGDNIREKFVLNNLNQLLHYEVFQMIKAGVKIKKCRCCNSLFPTGDMKKNYCDRIIDKGKTCKDVGPGRHFREQKKDDEMYRAYRKAYDRNKVRQGRGNITAEEFKFWEEIANEKRKNKSEDFYEWLDLKFPIIKEYYAIQSRGT